jgi:putative ABC transport system permease protein
MILNSVKLAIRDLLKNKVYSILIIGGFSIGFTACILIGLFYFTEKNVNSGFANHKQIYRLYDIKKNTCYINYDLNNVLASGYSEIANTCPMDYFNGFSFAVKDEQANVSTVLNNVICTNNNFFEIFSVDIIESLSSQPFDGKESVVITESVAKRLYKNGGAIGQTITIDNYYAVFHGKITAVIKDLPENSTFKAEIILNSNNEAFRLSRTCNDGKCYYPTKHYVLLTEATDINNFASRLNSTVNLNQFDIDQLELQAFDDFYLTSLTMKDMHFKGNAKLLKIFLAISMLILILSSINFLNYTISMQYAKLKTIGINITNGAGWRQLVTASFIEVSVGIIISVALSLILTSFMLPYAGILFGKAIFIERSLIFQLLPVLAVTIIIVILLNSLAPFYLLSRFNVTDFLSGLRKSKGKQVGKQVMLIFQLATSVALIAVVIGVFRQLNYVKQSDLGFDKELLLRIDLPNDFKKTDALRQEVNRLPFVSKSALSNGCPGKIGLRMGSNTGNDDFIINCITIGDEYLETMGIELVNGRKFLSGDVDKVCLLNDAAVKRYGFDSIEGKRYNNGKEGGYEIIGVTNNFHISSFYDAIEPVALIYNPDVASSMLSVKLIPGNTEEYINQLKNVWEQFLPYETMNYTFYDEQFQAMYSKDDKMAKSISFFSFIAIILTCMGILAQIFSISLYRTKEIGIRKINGAKISEILILLNKDFITCVLIAFAIATPIAYYSINKWLQSFAYKTTTSWWIFALSGLLTFAIAILTVSWQSWRAATRNPVEALRYE